MTPCTVGGISNASNRPQIDGIGLENPTINELPRDLFDEERYLAGMTKYVRLEIFEVLGRA